jgi:hypothetical protein
MALERLVFNLRFSFGDLIIFSDTFELDLMRSAEFKLVYFVLIDFMYV